jgi:hypothetical protein
MKSDFTLPFRTVIRDETTQIEVLYDNFNNSISNAWEYIEYGNRFTRNTRDHWVEQKEMLQLGDTPVHLLKWSRRILSRVPGDKNHYVTAEIIKNDREVYTIFIKSSEPIVNEMAIINSFQCIEKQGVPRIYKSHGSSRTRINTETKNFYNAYFGPAASLRWGIFEPSAPETFQYLTPLETSLNYSFPVPCATSPSMRNFPAVVYKKPMIIKNL